MVGLHTQCAINRGFDLQSDQNSDYKYDMCCFSAKYAANHKATDRLRVGIMRLCGLTRPPRTGVSVS
jgi:hypothetical protein